MVLHSFQHFESGPFVDFYRWRPRPLFSLGDRLCRLAKSAERQSFGACLGPHCHRRRFEHSSRLSWKSRRMATRALSRSGDFHDAQFLGGERSHDAAVSDGDVPEEYFHAGRGSFLHASRNRPAEPRFPPCAGSLIGVPTCGARLFQRFAFAFVGAAHRSAVGTNSTGTPVTNARSQRAHSSIPACSDGTCPSSINAFARPSV